MGAPQIILIIFMTIGLVTEGEKARRYENNNFRICLLGTGIIVGLLLWGGFFW